MSLDGSFVGAFDLTSQAGVTAVLASIRASQLTPAEKNELRDLVFMYTNGGGDASVRIALEQKLQAHHIVPLATAAKPTTAAPALEFGTYRPTPSFKAPVVEAMQPQPAPVVPAPAPVAPQPAPVPPPVAPPAPAFVPPPVPPQPAPTPVPQQPAPAPVPQPAPVAQPAPATPSPDEAAYLERIRQIKTSVNSKVGNPVNLVDINNEVGREYMNALLEAMKKLGSGAVSEMGAAMQRLETAYVAVEAAIKQHEAQGGAVPGPTTPPPSPNPPPVYTAPAAPVPPPRPVVPVPPPLVPPPAPVVPPAPAFVPPPAPPQPAPAPVPPAAPVVPRQQVAPEASNGPSGFADVEASAVPSRPVDVPGATAPTAPAVPPPAAEKADPLYNREVDEGLDQLLSDWSLFKKSGLFGTGPKGREHPLYKKIADLQVPLLLAGRFDGATQDIRQSITDYMNGWRYEQGIIYQPGETFEKYLRRVIKHILDLQKKRRHA